jgi:REP element-mobilizing transposase RayT
MPFVHVWFSTKGRRRVLEGDLLDSARLHLRSAAERHGIRLMECEGVIDHFHLLVEPDELNELPRATNLLKGASAYAIFREMPLLKLDMHSNNFWQAGYASRIVAPGALPAVRRYIRTQWDRLEKFDH